MNSARTITAEREFAERVISFPLAPAVGSTARGPRTRTVALPIEHGGWAFLLEPIVLGLLLAPSVAGVLIALAATGLFLARQPFKLAAGDFRKHRRSPRTQLAIDFGLAYASTAALFLVLALIFGGPAPLLPLLIAVPFTAIQLFYDAHSRSRSLIAELSAAVATGAVAVAIALAAGWASWPAFALWGVVIGRSVPSILYVRARLRLMRGKKALVSTVTATHIFAFVGVLALASFDLAPFLAVAAFAVLAVRAAIGLASQRKVAPKSIGIAEILYGAVIVFSVVIGQAIGW